MMHKKTMFLFAKASLLTLSACTFVLPPSAERNLNDTTPVSVVSPGSSNVSTNQQDKSPYHLADSHWSDVAKIRAEADRLSFKISNGKMDKVEVARRLNNFRISLVGHNTVDDSIFQVYLHAAIDSSQGKISSAQSKNLIKSALEAWHERWNKMPDSTKPSNPAFTNFLNELMGLSYLE